jgi:ADP-ribosylglycohydrolase
MDDTLVEQVKGCIYGHAIGDALGVGAEGLSKRQVSNFYPGGLTDYDQFILRVRRFWRPGEWTDDTEQMLCILDSILEKKEVDVIDVASRFLKWYREDGRGIGGTVRAVLNSADFLRDPHSSAKEVWERSQKQSAANGAVMRTSVMGIWKFREPERVKANAERVCKITHFDPRCVGSCVMVSLMIASFLRGDQHVEAIIRKAASEALPFDQRISEYIDRSISGTLKDLDLDEGLEPGDQQYTIGYTLKATAAGLWALKNSKDFEEGIVQVIKEGGDADSNAAVAGALLGVKFGYSRIPERWKAGLLNRPRLDESLNKFIAFLQR